MANNGKRLARLGADLVGDGEHVTVTSQNIPDAGVTNAKLGNGAVGTTKIADDAVNRSKLGSDLATPNLGLSQSTDGGLRLSPAFVEAASTLALTTSYAVPAGTPLQQAASLVLNTDGAVILSANENNNPPNIDTTTPSTWAAVRSILLATNDNSSPTRSIAGLAQYFQPGSILEVRQGANYGVWAIRTFTSTYGTNNITVMNVASDRTEVTGETDNYGQQVYSELLYSSGTPNTAAGTAMTIILHGEDLIHDGRTIANETVEGLKLTEDALYNRARFYGINLVDTSDDTADYLYASDTSNNNRLARVRVGTFISQLGQTFQGNIPVPYHPNYVNNAWPSPVVGTQSLTKIIARSDGTTQLVDGVPLANDGWALYSTGASPFPVTQLTLGSTVFSWPSVGLDEDLRLALDFGGTQTQINTLRDNMNDSTDNFRYLVGYDDDDNWAVWHFTGTTQAWITEGNAIGLSRTVSMHPFLLAYSGDGFTGSTTVAWAMFHSSTSALGTGTPLRAPRDDDFLNYFTDGITQQWIKHVPGAVLQNNVVTSDTIATNAVVAGKVANNAINSDQIVDGAITASKLSSNTITASLLQSNSVTTEKVATNAIDSSKVSANAIDTSQLATDSVTGTKIADNSVTGAKISYSGTRSNTNQYLTIASDGTVALASTGAASVTLSSVESAVGDVDTLVTRGDGYTRETSASTPGSGEIWFGTDASTVIAGSAAMNTLRVVKIHDTDGNSKDIAAAMGQMGAGSRIKIQNGTAVIVLRVDSASFASNVLTVSVDSSGSTDFLFLNGTNFPDGGTWEILMKPAIGDLITGGDLLNNSISTPHLQDAVVTSDKIAPNAVITAKIATNAIGSAQIQDAVATGDTINVVRDPSTVNLLGSGSAATKRIDVFDGDDAGVVPARSESMVPNWDEINAGTFAATEDLAYNNSLVSDGGRGWIVFSGSNVRTLTEGTTTWQNLMFQSGNSVLDDQCRFDDANLSANVINILTSDTDHQATFLIVCDHNNWALVDYNDGATGDVFGTANDNSHSYAQSGRNGDGPPLGTIVASKGMPRSHARIYLPFNATSGAKVTNLAVSVSSDSEFLAADGRFVEVHTLDFSDPTELVQEVDATQTVAIHRASGAVSRLVKQIRYGDYRQDVTVVFVRTSGSVSSVQYYHGDFGATGTLNSAHLVATKTITRTAGSVSSITIA